MRRICDIIEVPEVETVIQVSAAEGMSEEELHKRIVLSFVITEDILRALEAILFTVRKGEGCGFIIKGNYGSGKSHLLAFLSALLKFPQMMDTIRRASPEIATYKTDLIDKRVFPVSITLTDYSVSNSLAEIVAEKISAALQRDGIGESVWDAERVVSDFEKIILPNIEEEFLDYLKSIKVDDLGLLPLAGQSNVIFGFLKEYNIPFRPFYDYQDIFKNIGELLCERYPGGMFLLIDELSEFLRARNRGDLVSEDIRFIQFLGERARETNLRIVMSMQEAIEEVAEISTDGLNRIKDRYPVRINLTSIHLRELVERRLLLKSNETINFIDDVYISIADSFPEWEISKEDFRSIYPVHPATFKMLEGITGIFSKTRGMVDFIYTEIKGDPIRGFSGIINESADTLLYPDRIFDHFRNNLEESIEYNKLMTSVFSAFEREIPNIFTKSDDRNVAIRVIKLILLFQILPGVGRPTAMELAHLVFEARIKLDPEYNYTFIREKILREMEMKCGYLGVERGTSPVRDRFYLQFEESLIVLFESKVRQFIAKNVNIEKQALWFFISRLQDKALPLFDFKGDDGVVGIPFENTLREGRVYLKDIGKISDEELATIDRYLSEDEYDFILFLGFPVMDGGIVDKFAALSTAVVSPLKDNIVFWKPQMPSESEFDLLLNAYARIVVFERNYSKDNQERGVKVLTDIVKDAEEKAFRVIKKLYSSGNLSLIKEGVVTTGEVLLTGTFEKTVELMIKDLLRAAFPSHSRVMPGFEIESIETYRQIILLFRERGEVDFNFEASRVMKNAVDALLKNSGLLKILQNVYRISPDPSKNIFIKDLLYEIEQTKGSFNDLYRIFRKGKYGIQRELFTLYLFFLSYSGFITIEKSGRSLRPERLDPLVIGSSDAIYTGEEISSLFIENYSMLEPFTLNLSSKNIHLQTQKRIWDELVEFKRNQESNIRESWASLDTLEEYSLFRENKIDRIRDSYDRLIGFMSNIKVSKPSREGLDILIESMGTKSYLQEDMEIDSRFRFFLQNELDQLIFIYAYLTDHEIYLGEEERLKSDFLLLLDCFKRIENLIIDNQIRIIIDRFNEFKDDYKLNYFKAHEKIHTSEIIEEVDKIKLTPPYRALANLSRIDTISVKDDLIRIDTLMREASMSVCRRSVSKELDHKPYCDCRLKGSELRIDITQIQCIARRGIEQYIHALNHATNRSKIINYVGALFSSGDVDKRDALKEIMELDPKRTSDNDLLRIANMETISLLNRALSGNIKIVRRRIRDFYNSIYGRRFRKNELMRIFNEWIEADSGDGREELIFEIVGLNEDRKTSLPALLMEELNRIISVDDEAAKVQAFALAWLLYDVENGAHFDIIKRVLFIDLDLHQVSSAIEIGRDILKSDVCWDEFFREDTIVEVFNLLCVKEMKPEGLHALFKSASGFRFIRDRIIELIIREGIKITKDITSGMQFDDSPHSSILLSIFMLDASLKKYYQESCKKEIFNKDYLFSAFESLFLFEKIGWLSLNNNILIDIIQEKITRQGREIRGDCDEYFKMNFRNWEKDDNLDIGFFIDQLASPMWIFFIFDSLRVDLFLQLEKRIQDNSLLKLKDRRLFLSASPSDTLTFRRNLFSDVELVESGLIFESRGSKWMFISAAEREYKKEKLWKIFANNEEMRIIVSFTSLDEKIHSTKQGIISLSEELLLFCDEIFIPLLKGIPKDRKVCILSDHGFIERGDYLEKNEPRYTHGGNSFYERIIPLALYERR
ncbi:MAG: DUF6079 family protein [Spirochaetota bacterium]|nr:DUF6079 family protein [Spirochaetota bacterium]